MSGRFVTVKCGRVAISSLGRLPRGRGATEGVLRRELGNEERGVHGADCPTSRVLHFTHRVGINSVIVMPTSSSCGIAFKIVRDRLCRRGVGLRTTLNYPFTGEEGMG